MQKYQKNWLVYTALFSILLFIVFLFIFPDATNSRHDMDTTPLFLFIILGCLVMPVIEEITFRGMFQKNLKKNKLLFYVSLFAIFNWFFFYDSFSLVISFIFLLITALLVFLVMKYKKDIYLSIWMVFNAACFGLIHYKIVDFYSLSSAYMIMLHFGLGLLLIWITYNFSLLKSMIAHISYNSFFIMLFLFDLFSINEEILHYEDELIQIEISETPNFSSNTMTIDWLEKGDSLAIKSTRLTEIVKYALLSDLSKTQPLRNPYQKYNVNARFKVADSIYPHKDAFLYSLQKLEIVEPIEKQMDTE